MNRRDFLQASLYSGLLFGASSLPNISGQANAFEPLKRRILVNTFMDGGPDMRHLVVPAPTSNKSSVGYQYWANRSRAHKIDNNLSAWQARFDQAYFPITVNGENWGQNGARLHDVGGKNNRVTFGIWRQAGWLIDMFLNGHVAMAFNVAGGRNRAHEHSSLQLNQGNVLSSNNDANRSGWGGRLARYAGGNSISVTNTPEAFSFGPGGRLPSLNHNTVDNFDLLSIQNSRALGLNEFDPTMRQTHEPSQKMARALSAYYAGMRKGDVPKTYQKFMDHEAKIRDVGTQIRERLESVPVPNLMAALRKGLADFNVNPDPSNNEPRSVLRSSYYFGKQMTNLYDVLAMNDILQPSTISLNYGAWDTHDEQRRNTDKPDLYNPKIDRGIESGFKDLFGGPFADDAGQLHSAFSALWHSMEQAQNVNRERLVFAFCGEFGRQIRDNGRGGTDHGTANLMLIVGENVRGGVYGDMFPETELELYSLPEEKTPDIAAQTDIDHLFAPLCDWVHRGAGSNVFPRIRDTSLEPDQRPLLESDVTFKSIIA